MHTHQFVADGIPDDAARKQFLDRMATAPRWHARKALAAHRCPRHLYKYFSLDAQRPESIRNLRSVLVDSKLWLSKPSSFNDPFEFRAYVSMDPDASKRRKYFEKSARRMIGPGNGARKQVEDMVRAAVQRNIDNPEFADEAFFRIRDANGVCCFSSSPRSTLMWSHYAMSHTGVALQFEVSRDIENLALARPVNYSTDFPSLVWPDDMEDVIDKVIFRKHEAWRYESEFRLVMYGFGDMTIPLEPSSLVGIVVGHRMTEESMTCLSALLSERRDRGYGDLAKYRCVPRSKDYGMNVIRTTR